MSVINTNITSMISQKNLNASKNSLTTAMERLSSGMRINSAKDDAAGQAIANRMTSQVKGLAQAQRNANDGISVAQTTEGALNQVNDNLQRIRELTVQAQNGTNNSDDLTSIQNEIGQRLNEINRISQETSFNGVKVLASDQGLKIQVGANDGEAISISLKEINAKTLNLQGFNVDGTPTQNREASVKDVQAKAGSSIATGTGNVDYVLTTENKKLTASDVISKLANSTTVTYAGTNLTYGAASNIKYDKDANSFTYDATITAADASNFVNTIKPASGSTTATWKVGTDSIEINIDSAGTITTKDGKALFFNKEGGQLTENSGTNTVAATATELMNVLQADSDNDFNTDAGAQLVLADGTKLTVDVGGAAAGGADITVTDARVSASDFVAAAAADGVSKITIAAAAVPGATGNVLIGGANEVKIGAADVYVNGQSSTFAVTTDDKYTTDLFVGENGSLTDAQDGNGKKLYVTADGSLTFAAKTEGGRTEDPLKALDAALNMVDALRSDLGAIQNRFESAITNLKTNETNLSAARSRIEDADYAVEVANMTRAQILQQAGTSVLAQANQVPQGVLSLLR